MSNGKSLFLIGPHESTPPPLWLDSVNKYALKVTEREKLCELMAVEFHTPCTSASPPYSVTFDPELPYCYLNRLTSQQTQKVARIKEKTLVAFVVYGDGDITGFMDANFSDNNDDAVRPTASFALFYREGPIIELVFYNIFFVNSSEDHKFHQLKDVYI